MSDNVPAAAPDDVRLLASELATVCGSLSEIATIWRRSWQSRPDLPLGLPEQLQDSQLAADLRELVGTGPGQAPGGMLSAASRLSALRDEIASAQTLTCGPETIPIGDAALWADVNAALHRAAGHLLAAS